MHAPSAGRILSETISIYFRNIVAFAVIVLLLLSPPIAINIWVGYQEVQGTGDPSRTFWFSLAAMVLSLILTPVTTGALTYGVFQQARGKHADVGDCLAVGFQRLLPVLGVGIVAGLLQGLGTLACIVPGFIVAAMLACAVPAAVVERTGVGASLSRSTRLTEGHRWTVFGVIVVIAIASWGVAVLIGMVLVMISPVAVIFVEAVGTVLFTGLQATAPAVIYYHLRRSKESIDVDEIAAVFD